MTDLNPVLDWHPPSDARLQANKPYRLFAQVGVPDVKDLNLEITPRSRNWTRKLWLDQGREGACTGFGAAHCLGIGMKSWQLLDSDAQQFYKWAQYEDRWVGENYVGSSVQGAMAGLKKYNIINGYWWIETPEEFKAALSRYGAIEIGSTWKSGMWKPDSDNMIHNTGSIEGGHAYCVGAMDLVRNRARIDNSWGKNRWGVAGSAWIDLDELFSLIFDEAGECALPRKKVYTGSLLTPPRP